MEITTCKFHCLFCKFPRSVRRLILDSLTVKEVLFFRLVNRCTFQWISEYEEILSFRLSNHTVHLKSITDLDLLAESQNGLPFSNFRLEFNTSEIKPLRSHTHLLCKIRHLNVKQMNMCITDQEFEFYDSLVNIETLHIDQIYPPAEVNQKHTCYFYSSKCSTHFDFSYRNSVRIPAALNSLKSLSARDSFDGYYMFKMLHFSHKLNYFNPGFENLIFQRCSAFNNLYSNHLFDNVCCYISIRGENVTAVESNYLDIDISNLKIEHAQDPVKFLVLFRESCRFKLLNVPTEFFVTLQKCLECLTESEYCGVLCAIKSLKGLDPETLNYELPFLEDVNFNCTIPIRGLKEQKSWLQNTLNCARWTALKSISGSLTISNEGRFNRVTPGHERFYREALAFRNFLFDDPQGRPRVTRIHFSFVDRQEKYPVVFRPQDFTLRFPNLQVLDLNISSFTKSDYTKLFDLLVKKTSITELFIKSPVLFDDYTFLGVYDKNYDELPSFRKMSKLRKFELTFTEDEAKSFDITDLLFFEAIQFMKLQYFGLKNYILCSVSKAGKKVLQEMQTDNPSSHFNLCFGD